MPFSPSRPALRWVALLGAALVAGLAVALLWGLGPSPTPEEAGSTRNSSESQPTGGGLHAPLLQGESARPRPGTTPQAVMVRQIVFHVTGMAPEEATLVRATVFNGWMPPALVHPTASPRLPGEGSPQVTGTGLTEDGRIALDISSLLGESAVGHLHWVVEAPSSWPAGGSFSVVTAVDATQLFIEVRLQAAILIRGKVVDAEGRPDPESQLALARPRGDMTLMGRLEGLPMARTQDGGFTLRARGYGRVVVLALPAADGPQGRLPAASQPIDLEAPGPHDVGTLALRRAPIVEGQVRYAGAEPPRAFFTASDQDAVLSAPELTPALVWLDDGPGVAQCEAACEAGGHYQLTTPGAGWCRVYVRGPPGPWPAHADVLHASFAVVRAPAPIPTLEQRSALLLVEVRHDGLARGAIPVSVGRGDERIVRATGADGIVGFQVMPDEVFEIALEADLELAITQRVHAPAAGQSLRTTLALTAAQAQALARAPTPPASPALIVWMSQRLAGPCEAVLRVRDAEGQALPCVWESVGGLTRWRSSTRSVGNGETQLVSALAPGSYTLEVEAEGHATLRQPFVVAAGQHWPQRLYLTLEGAP